MNTAIVCGSHTKGEQEEVFRALDLARSNFALSRIITGGADYIDNFAMQWAIARRVDFSVLYAKWSLLGNFAGPSRNCAMLRFKPDVTLAFEGGSGTNDMKLRSRDAGVKVYEWYEHHWTLDSFFKS
jgi:hypothetical protein